MARTKRAPRPFIRTNPTRTSIHKFHTSTSVSTSTPPPSLHEYQLASLAAAQRTGGIRKNIEWLRDSLPSPPSAENNKKRKWRLLDVGAIDGNTYAKAHDFEVKSIDLHPLSSKVEQADFLTFENGEIYDIVALSLVLNFAKMEDRGRMIQRASSFLEPGKGWLYLTLPLPCIENSRYMTNTHVLEMCKCCGFELVRERETAKMKYWVFLYTGVTSSWSAKKVEVRGGAKRNNFWMGL